MRCLGKNGSCAHTPTKDNSHSLSSCNNSSARLPCRRHNALSVCQEIWRHFLDEWLQNFLLSSPFNRTPKHLSAGHCVCSQHNRAHLRFTQKRERETDTKQPIKHGSVCLPQKSQFGRTRLVLITGRRGPERTALTQRLAEHISASCTDSPWSGIALQCTQRRLHSERLQLISPQIGLILEDIHQLEQQWAQGPGLSRQSDRLLNIIVNQEAIHCGEERTTKSCAERVGLIWNQ